MMIDVTSSIQAVFDADPWPKFVAMETAFSLADVSEATVDWDYDAGESWARILRRSAVTALVRMDRPLIAFDGRHPAALDARLSQVVVLVVPSFDSAELSVEPEVIDRLFPRINESPVFRAESFSVQDLWYATT